ncbi:MAG: glycosyltransferase, partial [Phycisphaerae bacterium]|nr:glycosyltransferase [Phycisphaerae bacterium]
MSHLATKPLRVALVHDWLTGMRGGEKVLAHLCRLMPQADIFTLFHLRGACPTITRGRTVRTSLLNDLPGAARYYRHLLPLMPLAVERMDVSGYDLVISSSHCVAKGIGGQRKRQLHICYCHTPMRYAWDTGEDYQHRLGWTGLALRAVRPYLRAWDRRAASRVDLFLANSACVAERIRRVYDRTSIVLYPPIDVDFFTPARTPREDFYLVVSALAPYKRIHQAIEAFARLKRPLKIIGSGQELRKLRRIAPRNVELLGWCSDEIVRDYYRRCRALIFPTLEDFGMVPLEAMACGTPVIAYGDGGALETVLDANNPAVEKPTGLLYRPQTPQALASAVEQFDTVADRLQPAN